MALGPNDPPAPIEREQGDALQLRLVFADGTRLAVDPEKAAAVLRGYAIPARMFRSRRIFDLVVEYVEMHAHFRSRGPDAEPDIDLWDRSFMARVNDTDILHDLFRAAVFDKSEGLIELCAKKTADMVRGGSVEEIKTLLGITDADVTPEQDLLAQQDYDRILRIIP